MSKSDESLDLKEHKEVYEEYAEFAANVYENEYTADTRKRGVRYWLQWCEGNEVDPLIADSDDVTQYLLSILNHADTTISGRMTAVTMFYSWANYNFDEVDHNPTEDVDISEEPFDISATTPRYVSVRRKEGVESPKALPKSQITQLFDPVPKPEVRNELLIRILWQTALRADEASRIKLDKIDLNKREIKIRSAKLDADHELYNRRVYYKPNLDWLMEQWIDKFRPGLTPSSDKSPYLFVTRKSAHVSPNQINDIVRSTAHDAGIQEPMYVDEAGKTRWLVTAHRIRHSAINYWANETNMNLVTIRRIAGHARLETTKGYIDPTWDQVRSDYGMNAPG